jgi:putative CocE/NonD family hydrolase
LKAVIFQKIPARDGIQKWHLGSRDNARGIGGTGRLSREAPAGATADSYVYDPRDPAPTLGGQVFGGLSEITKVGPADQHPILERTDVLYYRSERLAAPLKVVGDIQLELWIASSAPDTDFVAKLCVENEMERVTVLTLGSLRCRYRDGWSEPRPLQPGEPAKLVLQLNHVAYTFPAGARIGLLITSSCCPRILPHRNTMAPAWTETAFPKAKQEVLHSRNFESCLLLPTVPLE